MKNYELKGAPLRSFASTIAGELFTTTDLCGDRWVNLGIRKAETVREVLRLIALEQSAWIEWQHELYGKANAWFDYHTFPHGVKRRSICPYCLNTVEDVHLHDCELFKFE